MSPKFQNIFPTEKYYGTTVFLVLEFVNNLIEEVILESSDEITDPVSNNKELKFWWIAYSK